MKDLKKHAISEYQDLYNSENCLNADGEPKPKKKKKKQKNKNAEHNDND